MEQITVQPNEINLFIQNNKEFYEKKFNKMRESGKSISWNWAAFFMGIYWMVYRKMYFKAAAFYVLSLVASRTPYIGSILNIAVLIGIAMYANALYMDHVEGNIKKIKMVFPHNKEEVIQKIGGTSMVMVIGVIVVEFIAIFFIMFLGI